MQQTEQSEGVDLAGRRVRLADGRIGYVQSTYGTPGHSNYSLDVAITERPGHNPRHPRITASVRRQRVVADLDPADVTVL